MTPLLLVGKGDRSRAIFEIFKYEHLVGCLSRFLLKFKALAGFQNLSPDQRHLLIAVE